MYGIYSLVAASAQIVAIYIQNDLMEDGAPTVTYRLWYRYVAGGVVMYVYVVLDWKWFKFFPLEADVFIDVSGRSK